MNPFPISPRGMIFDLDGTLLDTEPLYTDAAQKILDPFGHTYTLELKRRVIGGNSLRSAQITIDEFGLPMTAEEYLKQRESHLLTLFPEAEEINGAGRFLHHAADRGITLGVATSSHKHLYELKTGRREWKTLFSTVICGDDDRLRNSKPAPDIFLLCAEQMSISPSDIIAFEDSRNGIEAARAAGMYVVAIESPYTLPEDLEGANMTAPDFQALIV